MFVIVLFALAGLDAQVTIEGIVRSVSERPLDEVKIEVLNQDGQVVASGISGPDGLYRIEGLPPATYYLKPSKNNDHLNGVSTFDIVEIARHILGVRTFTDPIKIVASDINRTREITTLDLIQLRQIILGIQNDFIDGVSWYFVKERLSPGTPADVLSSLEELLFIDAKAGTTRLDLQAIKLGDVNYSATY